MTQPGPGGGPPAHHGPDGRFRNPWALGREAPAGRLDMLKWAWERLRGDLPPDPSPARLGRAEPELARPRLPAESGEWRLTWIGQASFLLQLPGANLLTDPVFGQRASPVAWAGPKRFTPPGVALADLPPIDGVLLSHDHYDHLDARSVAGLRDRFGEALTWFTPLGYARWFARRGVDRVVELDWWEEAVFEPAAGASLRLRSLPARHWTRRHFYDTRKRLWCSWGVEAGGAQGARIYFGGDSGYGPGFSEIGEREEGFDVALLPIGAYEPRWFMKPAHMNPEEAVQACRDVGAGAMVGMHWGTFRLTDEDPLEPPVRARSAWAAVGRAARDLHIPAHGQTLRF